MSNADFESRRSQDAITRRPELLTTAKLEKGSVPPMAGCVVPKLTSDCVPRPVPIDSLRPLLPEGVLLTDPDLLAGYRTDETHNPGAGTPAAVVRVTCAEQVQDTLRWASANRVAIIPRGAGSGLAGGVSAFDDAVVLSLERLTGIEIDPVARVAYAEAGALNGAVKRAAAEHGLWYPPDPSSFEICSIGGNVATNAGGLCCVKYGVTTDYVLGLDVVLADGRLVTVGGPRIKDVAGLSLTKLFVGSEGTLGVVTRAVLRLVPAQGERSTLVALFPTVAAAGDAVVEVGQSIRPSMVELMDHASINAVEDYEPRGLDRSARALLIFQSDSPGTTRTRDIEVIHAVAEKHGATEIFETDDAAEGEQFVAARRSANPACKALGSVLTEDVAVSIPHLPALLRRIEEISAAYGVAVPTVAHAGDGNLHPHVIYDETDAGSVARAHAVFAEIMHAAMELGGTITGEHGVGRAKASYLADQLGPDVMALTRSIKSALDPLGILNPGAGI
jgi:glycolate oxidase